MSDEFVLTLPITHNSLLITESYGNTYTHKDGRQR